MAKIMKGLVLVWLIRLNYKLVLLYLQKPVLGEIGELVSGKLKADKSRRTLFKSLGRN